ncbi:hypothetical protein FIBSPDRAFT_1043927 [Athelia psychrophila]|uniref:NADP-dependent oxidoreductase domain-containing protein n=1 Tax=Athelia psychrophila TaxID=1759441 RepID=A0A166KEH1_9AGAM|nr:hypothetical protein FIBSPDRAFT_1043927 [Fibularhizoctonia sp. CBS 109695]
MGISASYGRPQSDEERFKILDVVYDRGVQRWDTANAYDNSEDLNVRPLFNVPSPFYHPPILTAIPYSQSWVLVRGKVLDICLTYGVFPII